MVAIPILIQSETIRKLGNSNLINTDVIIKLAISQIIALPANFLAGLLTKIKWLGRKVTLIITNFLFSAVAF